MYHDYKNIVPVNLYRVFVIIFGRLNKVSFWKNVFLRCMTRNKSVSLNYKCRKDILEHYCIHYLSIKVIFGDLTSNYHRIINREKDFILSLKFVWLKQNPFFRTIGRCILALLLQKNLVLFSIDWAKLQKPNLLFLYFVLQFCENENQWLNTINLDVEITFDLSLHLLYLGSFERTHQGKCLRMLCCTMDRTRYS